LKLHGKVLVALLVLCARSLGIESSARTMYHASLHNFIQLRICILVWNLSTNNGIIVISTARFVINIWAWGKPRF